MCYGDMYMEKDVMHTWLCTQPKIFKGGITKLVDQNNKCMEKLGDCIEK
jgi:hypothetical protein